MSHQTGANQPALPRLDPGQLRRASRRDGVGTSFLADVIVPQRSVLDMPKAFWVRFADYNPLGQFGAALTSDFSPRPPDNR